MKIEKANQINEFLKVFEDDNSSTSQKVFVNIEVCHQHAFKVVDSKKTLFRKSLPYYYFNKIQNLLSKVHFPI